MFFCSIKSFYENENLSVLIKEIALKARRTVRLFFTFSYKKLCVSLIARGILDNNYFDEYKNNHVPLIRQRMNDAIGYIEAHRYDPGFKNAYVIVVFFRPEGHTKKSRLNKFGTWLVDNIKKKPIKLALKCAEVLEEIDAILESLVDLCLGWRQL